MVESRVLEINFLHKYYLIDIVDEIFNPHEVLDTNNHHPKRLNREEEGHNVSDKSIKRGSVMGRRRGAKHGRRFQHN